jgi:MFS transporter, PAT family, beta-lactamase induction signal transducer AmpG
VSGLLGDWLGYFNYLCMIVVIAMLSLWFIFKWRGIEMHSDLS